MSTTPQVQPGDTAAPAGNPGIVALIGALAFMVFYLAMDFVHGAVATGSRALPNDPDDVIYRYLVNESAAVAAGAGMMLVSVTGLLVFILAARRALPATQRGQRFGLLAVAAMAVSIALSAVLAATASSMSVGTVVWLNDAGFIAGGVAHVVCLGLYVGLTGRMLASRSVAHVVHLGPYVLPAGRMLPSRGLRVFAVVAAVPALLSVVSLVWFPASALILLGRLLCMVWLVIAGVALVRATHREQRIDVLR